MEQRFCAAIADLCWAELPNPLFVQLTRGDVDLEVVLRDVLTLTKLNYNACIYGDGVPVTLRFADSVGGNSNGSTAERRLATATVPILHLGVAPLWLLPKP